MEKRKKVFDIIAGILSVGLSGFLCEPLKILLKKILSLFDGLSIDMDWLIEDILSVKISLLDIFLFVILLIVLILLFHAVKKLIFKNTREAKIELLKQNNRYEDDEILATWTVYEKGYMSNNPFIDDLTLYCKRGHAIPLKMSNGRCTDPNCPNYQRAVDVHDFQNRIESMLAAEKDKLGLN